MSKPGMVALFKTRGPREARHKFVVYFRLDTDWNARNLERNGHSMGDALAKTVTTKKADTWLNTYKRAMSLQYSGDSYAATEGMKGDMEWLGFPPEVVSEFCEAALTCFK